MGDDKNVAIVVYGANLPRYASNDVVNELCDPSVRAFKRFALRKFDFFRVIPPNLQNLGIFNLYLL